MKNYFIDKKMERIASLIEAGFLSYIDFALAAQLIEPLVTATENMVAFLCHLSAATRRGHLCVIVDDATLKPSAQELWSDNQNPQLPDFYKQLEESIILGKKSLPECLITNLKTDVNDIAAVQTPLCSIGQRIYLQRYWMYETLFHLNYVAFTCVSPQICFDKDIIASKINNLGQANTLLPEQKKAILNATDHPLTIISGGPGTGKSYTAGQLVRILWESLPPCHKKTFKVALAAPTGKAAANLQKSLLSATSDIPSLQTIQAMTLHRLLDIRVQDYVQLSSTLLSEDLLIIDESSMIDMRMMGLLFAAIKPGARLILLGDKYQLPAIDTGAPFADLIAMESSYDTSYVTELKVCLRAELQDIIDFAASVNQGDYNAAERYFRKGGPLQSITMVKNEPTKEVLNKLVAIMLPHYFFDSALLKTPSLLFKQSNRFRALSPLKKGAFGVEQINHLIHKRMTKSCLPGKPLITPIIVLKNDYKLEVYNGEVGLLVRPNFQYHLDESELCLGDYILLPAKDGSIRTFPALLLQNFEHAYCLSVHKSQGSEFEHILLMLPSGAENFGREVLYTGVTRARRRLDIWAFEGILKETIERKSYRLSRQTKSN